jgi:cytochrome P450
MPYDIASVPVAPGGLPFLGHLLSLRKHPLDFLYSLRDRGAIVRIDLGPWPVYVLTDPDLVHGMLVSGYSAFEKGRVADKVRRFLGSGLINSGGTFHRQQRRLMQPAFQRRRIEDYARLMTGVIEEYGASWRPGEVRDLTETMHELALRSLAKTLFSGALGAPAAAEVQRCLPVVLKGMVRRTLSPADWWERVPTPGNRRLADADVRMRAAIQEMIDTYRSDRLDRRDLLSILLLTEDSGEGMTDQQISNELVTLAVAGMETTGTTLAWMLHEIARRPEIEERLLTELDEVLGGNPVTVEDLPRLTYGRALIDETLRLYHPTWILMRRSLQTVRIGDHTFPAGVEFLFSLSALYRAPELFTDPLVFDPERWITGSARDLPRTAFIPFGAGNRGCIGDTFAITEMLIALAIIVPRWRMRHVPGARVRESVAVTIRPKNLLMTVEPR